MPSYFSLLQLGFAMRSPSLSAVGLLHHHFTLTPRGAVFFLCAILGVTPTRVSRATRSWSPTFINRKIYCLRLTLSLSWRLRKESCRRSRNGSALSITTLSALQE